MNCCKSPKSRKTSASAVSRLKDDAKKRQTSIGSVAPSVNSVKTVGTTKWLALETVDYTDEKGRNRKWDMATRTTKQLGIPDAVVIIPLLRNKGEPSSTTETILVEQYRVPVQAVTLEFPAGLIDEGETAEQAAIRELKEETGFVGHLAKAFGSRELCMTPGMVNETIKVVIVHVDLDDAKNQNPVQELDDGEHVIVKRVPLRQGLTEMMEKGSNMPISLLYFFSLGFEFGSLLSLDKEIQEGPLSRSLNKEIQEGSDNESGGSSSHNGN